jgi:hypothetical protein
MGAMAALITAALVTTGTATASAAPDALPVQGTVNLTAVHCMSSSYCLAVGGGDSTLLVNGQEGGAVPLPDQVTVTGMACPTSADCFAVGQEAAADNPPQDTDGVVVPFIYGEAQTPIDVPGTSLLSGIDCTKGTTSCVAVGDETYSEEDPPYRYGTVVDLHDGTPSGAVQAESDFISFSAIACMPGSACEAVGIANVPSSSTDEGGIVTVTAGTASSDDQVLSSVYNFSAVACSSAGQCWTAGVGASDAQIVPIASGSAGSPIDVTDVTAFSGATCPTPTTCDLSGQNSEGQGIVLPIMTSAAGSPQIDLSGTGGNVEALSCLSANQCVGVGTENGTGVVLTSAVATAPTTVKSVTFSRSGYGETVTVHGTNFSDWAPEASPANPVSCVRGSPSYDYPSGVLTFVDTTASWSAGAPADCTGVVVASWSNTQVIFSFGAGYVWPLLQPGDAFQLSILGNEYSGTARIPAVPLPTVTSVAVLKGKGTNPPTVSVVGMHLGTRTPVPDPLTPVDCVSGDTSYTYPGGQLSFTDASQGWEAGLTGDCIGLVITRWTSTKVVFSFGAYYPNVPPVTRGDAISVVLEGSTASGLAGA